MNESKVIEFLREKLKDARDFANKVGDVFYATHISEPNHGPHANWAYGFRDDIEKALDEASRAGGATPGLEEVDLHNELREAHDAFEEVMRDLNETRAKLTAAEAEVGSFKEELAETKRAYMECDDLLVAAKGRVAELEAYQAAWEKLRETINTDISVAVHAPVVRQLQSLLVMMERHLATAPSPVETKPAEEFVRHLEAASEIVRSWPEWKSRVLGDLAARSEG